MNLQRICAIVAVTLLISPPIATAEVLYDSLINATSGSMTIGTGMNSSQGVISDFAQVINLAGEDRKVTDFFVSVDLPNVAGEYDVTALLYSLSGRAPRGPSNVLWQDTAHLVSDGSPGSTVLWFDVPSVVVPDAIAFGLYGSDGQISINTSMGADVGTPESPVTYNTTFGRWEANPSLTGVVYAASIIAVPEPSSLVLVGLLLPAVCMWRGRR